jgi:hypothetical protein
MLELLSVALDAAKRLPQQRLWTFRFEEIQYRINDPLKRHNTTLQTGR